MSNLAGGYEQNSIPPRSSQIERRLALDVLRLFAALAVLLFHFGFRMGITGEGGGVAFPEMAGLAKFGSLGVAVFFAISGYVITVSAEERGALSFGVARFVRLWPAFVVCATISFLVLAGFGGAKFETTTVQWLANLTMVPPLLGQPFVDAAYWSIFYELVFYGWVFLFLLLGVFNGRVLQIALAWLAIAAANQFVLGMPALRYLFLTDYAPFFIFGLLAREIERRPTAVAWLAAAATVPLCIAVRYQLNDYSERVYGVHYSLGSTIVATLVALGAFALALGIRLPARYGGAATLAGAATYPLYLLHQNIGYIAFGRFGDALGRYAVLVGLIAVFLAAAIAINRLVEPPASRLLKGHLDPLVRYLNGRTMRRLLPA